jgi:hypothetical protein
MRDGRYFYVLKEGAEYGDDPEHAFDLVASEMFSDQNDRSAESEATDFDAPKPQGEADARWDAVRAAIEVVGAGAVARRLAVAARTVRAWMADRNRRFAALEWAGEKLRTLGRRRCSCDR